MIRAGGGAWTERMARWYARAMARADYAPRVLAALAPALAQCRDALDVGAGCGALAVPLASRLERVTALEPDVAMVRALREAVERAQASNVTVIQAAWGDAAIAPHDLVLCAHVGGLLRGGSPFLRDVGRVARRWVAALRDWPGTPAPSKFYYDELYPRLLGRPYADRCESEDPVARLRALGFAPEVTLIEYEAGQPFTDLDEACDFWMTYMRLADPAARAYLAGFLGERLVRDGDGLFAPFRRTAALIRWHVQR